MPDADLDLLFFSLLNSSELFGQIILDGAFETANADKYKESTDKMLSQIS